MTGYLTFVLAFVAILAVIGVAAWLVRRFVEEGMARQLKTKLK